MSGISHDRTSNVLTATINFAEKSSKMKYGISQKPFASSNGQRTFLSSGVARGDDGSRSVPLVGYLSPLLESPAFGSGDGDFVPPNRLVVSLSDTAHAAGRQSCRTVGKVTGKAADKFYFSAFRLAYRG